LKIEAIDVNIKIISQRWYGMENSVADMS